MNPKTPLPDVSLGGGIVLGTLISRGRRDVDPWMSSPELSVWLASHGYPSISATVLGQYLGLARYPKRKRWDTRECYSASPDQAEHKDFTSRPVNTWCIKLPS